MHLITYDLYTCIVELRINTSIATKSKFVAVIPYLAIPIFDENIIVNTHYNIILSNCLHFTCLKFKGIYLT
jgi:hypothetical protein